MCVFTICHSHINDICAHMYHLYSQREHIQYLLGNPYHQLPLILTALLNVDLINVAYLTACAFIRS